MTSATVLSPSYPDTDIEKGVALWKRKQVSGMVTLGVLLFLSAGTLEWPQGWLYLIIYGLTILTQAVVLLPRSPGLLAERAKLQKGTKRWDAVMSVFGLLIPTMATLVVAGLDFRNGWTPPLPLWVTVISVLIMVAGWVVIIWAMLNNPFFSATVRVQDDRGQRVMTGGPYQVVRHPGYVGAILYNAVTPLILGSLWALIPSLIVVVFFVARTVGEDPVLQRELPGYSEYAQQVHYRLVPGLW